MTDITMPRLSDTMEEGVLAQWHKQVGDEVHKGDTLADIETDKTTMELEAYDAGILERLLVDEGDTVSVGEPIAVVGDGSGADDEPAEQDEQDAEGENEQAADTEEERPPQGDGEEERPPQDDGEEERPQDDGAEQPPQDDGEDRPDTGEAETDESAARSASQDALP